MSNGLMLRNASGVPTLTVNDRIHSLVASGIAFVPRGYPVNNTPTNTFISIPGVTNTADWIVCTGAWDTTATPTTGGIIMNNYYSAHSDYSVGTAVPYSVYRK